MFVVVVVVVVVWEGDTTNGLNCRWNNWVKLYAVITSLWFLPVIWSPMQLGRTQKNSWIFEIFMNGTELTFEIICPTSTLKAATCQEQQVSDSKQATSSLEGEKCHAGYIGH